MPTIIKASAPATLMLLGEHAVLSNKHAVVCAVNKRIHLTLIPNTTNQIEIQSALGHTIIDLQNIRPKPPFQFILAILKKYKTKITTGCVITIDSDFSDQVGLGSSAAVTVACLAAIKTWLELTFTRVELIKEARKLIRQVQGLGSGADIAASVLGGIVAYKAEPLLVETFTHQHALTVVYSGYKTPTVQVVRQVQESFKAHPELYKKICNAIDACAITGIEALRKEDWHALGSVMNIQQGLMEALGVSTPQLADLIHTLRSFDTIKGAKISGSGLGDCVIGLGSVAQIEQIPIELTNRGVCCDKT